MYAIINILGHQFKIKKNINITTQKINEKTGTIIKLNPILILNKKNNIIIGKKLNNYIIHAIIKKHFKNKKITIIKFKRRKNYKRKIGHRQNLTILNIISIKKKKKKNGT